MKSSEERYFSEGKMHPFSHNAKIGGKRVKVESGSVVFVTDSEEKPEKKECGRPNCLSEEKIDELLDAYHSKPYSLREIAEIFGVSRMMVWRTVRSKQGYLVAA